MIHLTFCHNVGTRGTDSQMRELARLLERDVVNTYGGKNLHIAVRPGTSDALICAEALRRAAG